MIASPDRRVVLSSLAWVDGDAIWCFDAASNTARTIPQNTGARSTSLHSSGNERFVAVHHFNGEKFMASVSLFSAPELTVSSVGYENGRSVTGGNADAWNGMPALFVEYLGAPWNDYVLITIDAGRPQIQRLEWYDAAYDKGRQQPVDVVAGPDPRYAFISVQHSSELVVHDLETGHAKAKIGLGAALGSSKLTRRSSEVWASDYDTMVVLDAQSLRGLRKQRLQRGGQFIGDYSFCSDGACCIARPYSGDVIAVNDRLKVQRIAKVGRQPYEAIELPGGNVIARDGKTGEPLTGRFERYNWIRGLFG
jgi:hypothetical protein